MIATRMHYPEHHTGETARQRDQRLALSRRANPTDEGGNITAPSAPSRGRADGVPSSAVRLSYLALPLPAFAEMDFGQLCQHLGLRPSKPHADASGRDARKRRSEPHLRGRRRHRPE